MWAVLSDEKTGLSLTVAAGLHQRSHIYHGQNQYYLSLIFIILSAIVTKSQDYMLIESGMFRQCLPIPRLLVYSSMVRAAPDK
jgi:hypothetical protein